MFNEKRILITGGTGSFGNAFIRHMMSKGGVGEIIVFSRDEKKQHDMRISYNEPALKFIIGDVRDKESVFNAMRGVDYVFHAAALKHVPSCEFFPMQAVMTNVTGSYNVIEAAKASKVSSVVCLGTDKAVYPINAMGMTKALMEKVAQSAAREINGDDTVISSVRYGNVMYSRGSVIPLFVEQIKQAKPLTVTDPGMTRFMLSLDNAIDLVGFALSNAEQGDIFVRKSPACTVEDLVVALKNLFKSEVPVNIIGMRHGEKIYETLLSREEIQRSEDMGDYFRVNLDDRNLNYDKYYTDGDLGESQAEEYHSHNTYRLSVKEVEDLLLTLPEIRAALG